MCMKCLLPRWPRNLCECEEPEPEEPDQPGETDDDEPTDIHTNTVLVERLFPPSDDDEDEDQVIAF